VRPSYRVEDISGRRGYPVDERITHRGKHISWRREYLKEERLSVRGVDCISGMRRF
jgi:hypothetical protein